MRLKKKLVGYVGVDSGQLIIVDPCYIDSHWVRREFHDTRAYTDNEGNILRYPEDFNSYEVPVDEYGRTMNELIREGIYSKVEEEPTREFSYDGACRATLTISRCGTLDIVLTSAVAFSSGYGDGSYPVYAYFNEDNRIVKVEILME